MYTSFFNCHNCNCHTLVIITLHILFLYQAPLGIREGSQQNEKRSSMKREALLDEMRRPLNEFSTALPTFNILLLFLSRLLRQRLDGFLLLG